MNSQWIPARVGDALADIDTPALILDLDKFETNLVRLSNAVQHHGVRVRPHAKSHKCIEIARRQIAAGAVGIAARRRPRPSHFWPEAFPTPYYQ